LEGAAAGYYHRHQSALAARQSFREDLFISETKPCEFVVREPGWWNVSMGEIFRQEAPAMFGQMELLPMENWQEFDVDERTGTWRPTT
jgi:hypothetical protein